MAGFERVSFTALSREGVSEMILRQRFSHEKYSLELVPSDFMRLAQVLLETATDEEYDSDINDWAAGMLAAIGETLGVEFV